MTHKSTHIKTNNNFYKKKTKFRERAYPLSENTSYKLVGLSKIKWWKALFNSFLFENTLKIEQ